MQETEDLKGQESEGRQRQKSRKEPGMIRTVRRQGGPVEAMEADSDICLPRRLMKSELEGIMAMAFACSAILM